MTIFPISENSEIDDKGTYQRRKSINCLNHSSHEEKREWSLFNLKKEALLHLSN